MKVEPDLQFLERVQQLGGQDVKQCFQCAACSVACNLSPASHPYPRKEMIWAGWGLRDPLMGDPDLWLCHQCNDCSLTCPRGAKPGDVLSALRATAVEHHAVPRFMGKLISEAKYLPVLIIGSLAFIAALIGLQQVWVGTESPLMFAEDGFQYEEFLAHRVINTLFPAAFFLAVGLAGAGAFRFWRAIDATAKDWGTTEGQGLIGSFIGALLDLALHRKFGSCEANRPRRNGHLLVFFGFMALLFVTAMVTVLAVLEHPTHLELYPLDWLHPLKILGNGAGLVMVAGALYVIYYRLTDAETVGKTRYFDWFFVVVLLMVGLTGFATEFVRLVPLPPALGVPMYILHLLSVFWLLIFFPFSKFSHAMYRYLAMVHARYRGRAMQTG